MANTSKPFVDPAGLYTGGYTSEILTSTWANYKTFVTRAIIQVEITSGTLELQMRLDPDAPWLLVRTYDTSILEEIVVCNYLRVVASGSSRAWLGVTK